MDDTLSTSVPLLLDVVEELPLDELEDEFPDDEDDEPLPTERLVMLPELYVYVAKRISYTVPPVVKSCFVSVMGVLVIN